MKKQKQKQIFVLDVEELFGYNLKYIGKVF